MTIRTAYHVRSKLAASEKVRKSEARDFKLAARTTDIEHVAEYYDDVASACAAARLDTCSFAAFSHLVRRRRTRVA